MTAHAWQMMGFGLLDCLIFPVLFGNINGDVLSPGNEDSIPASEEEHLDAPYMRYSNLFDIMSWKLTWQGGPCFNSRTSEKLRSYHELPKIARALSQLEGSIFKTFINAIVRGQNLRSNHFSR